jgi:hypothetical protein
MAERRCEMSDCGVCIGGYDSDGTCDFYDIRWPKARKEHRCEDCNRTIAKGDEYQRCAGKYDGEFFYTTTCKVCVEIRAAFTCTEYDQVGPPPGELWSDIQEQMFPVITTACYDKLKTPEAKAHLRDQWRKWKGLAA